MADSKVVIVVHGGKGADPEAGWESYQTTKKEGRSGSDKTWQQLD